MLPSSQKRRVSVTIDAHLLDEVDRLTDNRSAAFEEALRLWRSQKIQAQLREFYQNRFPKDLQEEEAWAQESQALALQSWDAEHPWSKDTTT